MTNPFAAPAQQPPAGGNPFGTPAQQPYAAPAPAPAPAPWLAAPPTAAEVQQYAAPPQAAPAPAGPPQIGSFTKPAPATVGGGQGADLKAMYGRLVLVLPIKVEHGLVSKFVDSTTGVPRVQSRMTATFVVLDGPNPIAYGGDLYAMPQVPHTKSEPLPHVSKALWVTQSKIIEACEAQLAHVAQYGPGSATTLGRLVRAGTEANSAWILQEYTAEDAKIAEYYLAGIKSGQFPNPLA